MRLSSGTSSSSSLGSLRLSVLVILATSSSLYHTHAFSCPSRTQTSFRRPRAAAAAPPRGSLLLGSPLHASTAPNQDEEKRLTTTKSSSDTNREPGDNEENMFQRTLSWLAQLSLEDYKWRSDVFKTNEADRMMEQSLARMRGDDPSYVRPMDATDTTIGPLGRWEKGAVEWLQQVIDEEGRRAEQIVNSAGRLVRPKDLANGDDSLGPLGFLEQAASDFIQSIRTAERERFKAGDYFTRPKDMDESIRGPLGEAELAAVKILNEIKESEKLRKQQSLIRGGELVRPIDVPGPLGDFEMAVLEIFDAEQKRAKEREDEGRSLIRPKDAKVRGPLGEAEFQAYETISKLSEEERERLESIKKVLEDNRPMEVARGSVLGILESIAVGVLRAPLILFRVIQRVLELLSSESLKEQLPAEQEKSRSPDNKYEP